MWMLAHDARLLRIERAVIEQHRIGDGNLPDVVEKAAALERSEIAAIQSERGAQFRGVVGEALTMPVRRGIARFDRGAQAEDHRLRRFELVGVTRVRKGSSLESMSPGGS
jgi:hypothetical protein